MKNVLVLGLGVTGKSAIKLFEKLNYNIFVYDDNANIDGYENYNGDFKNIDFILKSPGINPNIEILNKARKSGIEIISDIELAYRLSNSEKFIAITGTNGKTTTTSLVYEILKLENTTYCVGNIGNPISDVVKNSNKDDYIVIEASSFQLEHTKDFKPKVAIITNITPDHLDWHGNFENYKNAKFNIFKNQDESDFLILNYRDENLKKLNSKSKKYFFSLNEIPEDGIYVKNGYFYLNNLGESEKLFSIDSVKIPGEHNLENIMCAIMCAILMGISKEKIIYAIENFKGVEHRIEYVKTINGARYYNDSKGTNPDSTIMAIKALEKNIILIAGGYNKNASFDEMLALGKNRVKKLVLYGATKEIIKNAAQKFDYSISEVKDLEEAVKVSYELAKDGDKVLLSPACASWDMYTSYEKRGEHFKKLVNELV